MKNKVEELHGSIEQQDKYLDEFEVKIENLEKDVKNKTDLLKHKDCELEKLKSRLSKCENENKEIRRSKDKLEYDVKKYKEEINNTKLDLNRKEKVITDNESTVTNLQREIKGLKCENENKVLLLKDLEAEIERLNEKITESKENKAEVFNCMKQLEYKYTCDMCGHKFPQKDQLKGHIMSFHETILREQVYKQRVDLLAKIKTLQYDENLNVHNCNNSCFINHRRFNFIRCKSNIFIEKLDGCQNEIFTCISYANNANNHTF